MTDSPELREARFSDAGPFAAHIVRHLAESGKPGQPHFAPVSTVEHWDVMEATERRWRTSLHEPGWGRAWLVVDPASPPPLSAIRVTGHAELRGASIHSGLHRAELSIGLESHRRNKGLGLALSLRVLEWARQMTELIWMDLRVFDNNTHARALYERLGFKQIGFVRDAFRLADGTRIDDILMTQKLRDG